MKEAVPWGELVKGALKKDQQATTKLITASQENLFTFCLFLCKNKQLAEDICHDAFLRALSKLDQLRDHETFPAWIKQIARSQYLDYLKASSQSEVHLQFEDLGDSLVGQDVALLPEQMTAMHVLHQLSEEDRAILILSDIQEYSYAEIAGIMKLAEGTVKSKLSRARDKFAEKFNESGTKSVAGSSSSMRVAK